MDDARRRAWKALELGPLWRARGAAGEGGSPQPAEPSGGEEVEARAAVAAAGNVPAALAADARAVAPASAPMAAPASATSATSATSGAPAAASAAEPGALDWPELRATVEACEACGLCRTRNRTVFGAGPQDARWLVVGEGPGAEEDASGEPFVGQAGRLLDAMLAAIDLDRGRNVFIANVVKCRPPGNRNPLPEESARCLPYLRRQIELLAPDFVLLLGRVAAHALLETDAAVGSLRGRVHPLHAGGRTIPAVVTWHPSYLLRRPEDKALAWADLCLARGHFDAAGAGASD